MVVVSKIKYSKDFINDIISEIVSGLLMQFSLIIF